MSARGLLAAFTLVAVSGCGGEGPPALDDITAADLARDIGVLSADSLRGREAGTTDELRAAAWLAEQARAAGLEPGGELGTFFQYVPLQRARFAASSRVTINDLPLELWRDCILTAGPAPGIIENVSLTAPVIVAGDLGGTAGRGLDVRGKAIAIMVAPPRELPAPGVRFASFRYALKAVREQGPEWAERGAAAIILVADSIAEDGFEFYRRSASRGRFAIDSGQTESAASEPPLPRVPLVLVTRSTFERSLGGRRNARPRITIEATVERFTYPSVNVIGRARGTDPALRDEYVLFSAHLDHDGVRDSFHGDSVWNGADDNATGSAALLAIGRAWERRPPKRSGLFVWHGAEERGLLGSRWYAAHPTVPREAIVAVLNADMIGRNHPDTAALLGAAAPNRNSAELVATALLANQLSARFALDTTWDQATHPEEFYSRSDHASYARVDIPALFYTTMLHADYHTPRDEAGTIDVDKVQRVAQWMYTTGWLVASANARPTLDPED